MTSDTRRTEVTTMKPASKTPENGGFQASMGRKVSAMSMQDAEGCGVELVVNGILNNDFDIICLFVCLPIRA
ncbi:hypothetical protein N8T08_003037 [Aspergillus melleus]|uniref:Uncharacterized protein n=1 Tax=Aspergillus melleus TaxID=138277 RepID=A0ACC3ALL2_9EURO|nr:hypothetical protein N8T08_003037 [Aspergillus melleus]